MFGLLPKNLEFFDCFENSAQNAVETAKLLARFSRSGGKAGQELVQLIKEQEHKGDRITHETLDRLERTYMTPIDREDIHRLITKIDDVVDAVDAVAHRMLYYKIDLMRPDFQSQCDVLVQSAGAMVEIVMALRHLLARRGHRNGIRIEKLVAVAHDAEEAGDAIHHRFLGELFDSGLDAFAVIKWKELYDLVEQANDYCYDVACMVHGIVLKNL